MPDRARHETLARQWELLRLLPSRPPGRTAAELTGSLGDRGFPTSKRTVERDLLELERVFPIRCNDKGMPYGWHWMRGADIGLPGVELAEALSLALVEDFLRRLLPLTFWRTLEPRLANARKKLKALAGRNESARWAEKIRYVSPTLPLVPPAIREDVLECVQRALLGERQLEVRYRGTGAERENRLRLHPLGIVQRGPVGYLVATAFEYPDIRFYALHRIRKAERLFDAAARPTDFSMDRYIAAGTGQFLTDSPARRIRLRARIDADLANVLRETALSEDMRLRPQDECFLLTATVVDTWQLRWWILSQGASIEVLNPKALRRDMADEVAVLHERYSATH